MKKLKTKVFLVVFLIMTLVSMSAILFQNLQLYNQEYRSVERSLNENMFDKFDGFGERPDWNNTDDMDKFKFMDTTVYTIVLDSDNDIIAIINHSENEIDENDISTLAKDFIRENQTEGIGNLYYEKYSCKFVSGSYITIVDNTNVNTILVTNLAFSCIVLALIEVLIFIISRRIAIWIEKPVAESFDKQKRFIADASHELKTPLAVIIASADALESNPFEKKWLNNIKSESDRMNRLIADLLELAKSEEVDDTSQFEVSNLSKAVEKATLTFEGVMFEKGITLKDNIEDNIEINMNEYKIEQLVSILLDNAIKHSERNSEIYVELKKEKNVTLKVVNKGEGIPKGEEEKIFERFYRADESRNRNENRYGLGLAIAKNIAANHGATISAKSENGYTEFKVVFEKVQ